VSTGFECLIVEVAPGEWYYLLQNGGCPVGAWDWREYADAYGPFPTEEAADQHLGRYQANPGGFDVQPFDGREVDETMRVLIADARR
jgi:hypothetical protein